MNPATTFFSRLLITLPSYTAANLGGSWLPLDLPTPRCHCYTMGARISIKQLHQSTGEQVRRAAKATAPIEVTDRGKPVAVLANPALLRPRRRQRTLLPEYRALLSRKGQGSVVEDLEAVRGDR